MNRTRDGYMHATTTNVKEIITMRPRYTYIIHRIYYTSRYSIRIEIKKNQLVFACVDYDVLRGKKI